jgi:hypothetical protein
MNRLRQIVPLAALALFSLGTVMLGQAQAKADSLGLLGEKKSETLIVRLSSSPSPPVRGLGSLEALVTDSAGKSVADAALSFDLDMIRMSHGKNVVVAAPRGEGRYRGEVRYMMPGAWRVIVRVARPGRETESFRFEFGVNLR